MKITKENEVNEVIRVFMLTTVGMPPFNTLLEIADKMRKYNCAAWSLGVAYQLGHMHGVQSERKRRSSRHSQLEV